MLACAGADPHDRVVVPRTADSGLEESRAYPDTGVPDGDTPAERVELCLASEDYLAERKGCDSDADCTLFTYQAKCCEEELVVGITREGLASAQTCFDNRNTVCGCAPGLKRAEDGRVVTERSQAVVQCIDRQCSSSIAQRQCGASRTCAPDQICVSYQNVPGGFAPDPDSKDNAYLTFRCEPNPCENGLACECAKSLCDARNDVVRNCEIKNNAEADMTCSAIQD
ncbi:MAG TPA: hypothetical protein VFN67_33695 [Polyangiales bacterium]|nr:hypothetical protein [Polyangiales bacterium]